MSAERDEDGPLSAIADYGKYNDLDALYNLTDQILGEIIADGNPVDEEYEIIHYFSSLNFADLEKFAVEVNNLFGGDVFIDDPEECADDRHHEVFFSVSMTRVHPRLDAGAVYGEIEKLVKLCNRYRIAYDGWGTGSPGDDDEEEGEEPSG